MSTRADIAERNRALRLERAKPVPTVTREDRDVEDLRQIIHILAMAMTEGKGVA